MELDKLFSQVTFDFVLQPGIVGLVRQSTFRPDFHLEISTFCQILGPSEGTYTPAIYFDFFSRCRWHKFFRVFGAEVIQRFQAPKQLRKLVSDQFHRFGIAAGFSFSRSTTHDAIFTNFARFFLHD